MTDKPSKILTGIAGEYFVAAELSRRGYIASITLRNTRGIDIQASNADASKSTGIQVKTKFGDKPRWLLTRKAEQGSAKRLCYVFVKLPASGIPEYYIVPRRVVSKYVIKKYKEWMAKPGRDGKQRRDNAMRSFRDLNNKYRDRWDLLGLD